MLLGREYRLRSDTGLWLARGRLAREGHAGRAEGGRCFGTGELDWRRKLSRHILDANDTDEWRRASGCLCGKATLPLVVRTAPSSASVTVTRGGVVLPFPFPFSVASSVSDSAGPASGDERNVCDFGLARAGESAGDRPRLEKSAEWGRGRVVAIAEGAGGEVQ